MSLLERHLEQISLSAESIASLPFPPPKAFTNALLHTPDITSLIRDTEPHERALFSVHHPTQTATASTSNTAASSRRKTVFNVTQGEVTASIPGMRAPRRNTAVAAVLGPELHREMKKTEGKVSGDIDIEVLLRGVEKLNAVYSLPGVLEQVQNLRNRYAQVSWAVSHYEDKVEKQMADLDKISREHEDRSYEHNLDGMDESVWESSHINEFSKVITHEDIIKEEDDIRELENRKRDLEDSIRGMERDLGGLMR